MFFVILASDRPGALELRLKHRQRHIDYWAEKPGVVKLAGAMLTDGTAAATPKGSAFIIEAESLDAARALLADDPFTIEGVFGDRMRIEPLRPSIGDWLPC
ncbi:YciI family protein [Acidocella sp. KAb 2-4]|uniref:YciI family protein n=1 Tax=Acidocella sp. KAb 2-4 TaxID=2885158 RepID=UPI001D06E4CE|nr:YciI family protein [Acidocella sp. KAb 2-4]MCB5945550.1 YciI family protein [Acidocella sp. KAb 2-4]